MSISTMAPMALNSVAPKRRADEAGQLGLRALRVGGDQDGAQAHEGQPGEEVGRGVAHGGEDQVAPADAEMGEPAGSGSDAVVRLLVGELPLLTEQPGPGG